MIDQTYVMTHADQLTILSSSVEPTKKVPSSSGPRNTSLTVTSKRVLVIDKVVEESRYRVANMPESQSPFRGRFVGIYSPCSEW